MIWSEDAESEDEKDSFSFDENQKLKISNDVSIMFLWLLVIDVDSLYSIKYDKSAVGVGTIVSIDSEQIVIYF